MKGGPDSDIVGVRVCTPSGAFGTVEGRDVFGMRWRVRLDKDAPTDLAGIYDPDELVIAKLRVAA